MNCNLSTSTKLTRHRCQFEGEIKNEVAKLGPFENKGVVNVIPGNDGQSHQQICYSFCDACCTSERTNQ